MAANFWRMTSVVLALIIILLLVVRWSDRARAGDTWCYASDSFSSRSCVYDLKQCEEIRRLRGHGICSNSQDRMSR